MEGISLELSDTVVGAIKVFSSGDSNLPDVEMESVSGALEIMSVSDEAVGVGETWSDPFSVLPKEIMDTIWSLTGGSGQQLWSLLTVSPSWNANYSDEICKHLFEMIFPYLFQYVDKSSILQCRQICKSWNNTICRFLQTHPCVCPYNLDATTSGKISLYPTHFPQSRDKMFQGVTLSTFREIVKFLKEWRDDSLNPFFEKRLSLNQDFSDAVFNSEEYWQNAYRLLKRFGKHVWILCVDITPVSLGSHDFDYYDQLRRVLKLVPNLKYLSISGDFPSVSTFFSIPEEMAACFCLNYLNFDMYARRKPLPPLPHLESLFITSESVIAPVRSVIVARYRSQLKRLRVPLDEVGLPRGQQEIQLKELDVCGVECRGKNFSQKWRLLQFTVPQLRKLTLRLTCLDNADITGLMSIVRRYPTLEYLEIRLMTTELLFDLYAIQPEALSTGVTVQEELTFPNIKYLDMTVDYLFPLFHLFLPYFPRLERFALKVLVDTGDIEGKAEELKKSNRLNWALSTARVFESVIWESIPTLKELACVIADCTDEDGSMEDEEDYETWEPPKINNSFVRCTRDMIQAKLRETKKF